MWIYVGTYTKASSRGIYGMELDPGTGRLSEPKLMAETPNPSFLAVSTIGDRLYAACDPGTFDGKRGGGVAAFAVDLKTKALTPLNTVPTTGGCCFVDVSADGRFVGAADYGSARIDLLPTRGDGSVDASAAHVTHHGRGPNTERQDAAHAHCMKFDPSGRFTIVCDLGTDEVVVYRVSTGGPALERTSAYKAAPGAGPRHLAFARDRRVIYVVNELNNTVDVLKWDAEAGTLTHEQTVPTLPDAFKAYSKAAEIAVHPSGAFVYASNRGHDSIACFHVEPGTGRLSAAGHTPVGGKGPRHFGVEPNGKYLITANEETDNVVVFAVHHETGVLTATGSEAKVSRPVCVRFSN